MPKIPQKFMGLIGKFADSLDYKDLPKGWADNPEIVQAAEELYRDMGTESPFFKAWFGNSKVVNDAGNPLPVYHGTREEFDTFNSSKYGTFGPAIYTTPDKKAAFEYAGGHGGNKVYELFVKSEKPFTVSDSLSSKDFWDISKGKSDEERIKDFLNKGYDSAIAKGYGSSVFGKTSPEIAVYSPSSLKSMSNRGTFNPDDPNIYKALPFAVGGAGAAAALSPGEASASVPAEQYRWLADEPGYVNPEQGLGSPLVDVADLATAPIGAATAAGRAASVAAEPFVAYGMEKAGNWVGDKVNGLLGLFGWGE